MIRTYTRNMARYRLRTLLRGHGPAATVGLFPKGTRDCGDHDWYRADSDTDRCYHCTIGVRPHVTIPITVGSVEWDGLVTAALAGSDASADVLVSRIEETENAARSAAHELVGLHADGTPLRAYRERLLAIEDPSSRSGSG